MTLLIVIHTVDMLLTERYIGNQWQEETFLPMSLCIKNFGIYNALWVSRIVMYSFFFLLLTFRESRWCRSLAALTAVLYWTSMIGWLFSLDLVEWPIKWHNVPC